MTTIAQLVAFGAAQKPKACHPALDWLDQEAPAQSAWEACTEPSWLLWLAPRAGVTGTVYAEIACEVVEQIALPHAGDNTAVVTETIATVRRYAAGNATAKDLADLADTAHAAAWAAAEAARAADDDAKAATYAARAADEAAWAAAEAAWAADDHKARFAAAAACNIIRTHIPPGQIETAIAELARRNNT